MEFSEFLVYLGIAIAVLFVAGFVVASTVAIMRGGFNAPRIPGGVKTIGVGVGILCVLLIAAWVVYENPRPQTMSLLSWNYIVPLLFFFMAALGAIALFVPAAKQKAAKNALYAFAGILLLMPVLSFLSTLDMSGSSCSNGHSCSLGQTDTGVTQAVAVPNGQVACFDPWIWDHLSEVGLQISYQGSESRPFPCSKADVFGGKCTAVYDHFWFKPSKKTRVPNYWFVQTGSPQC